MVIELEKVSGLTHDEAKTKLMNSIEIEMKNKVLESRDANFFVYLRRASGGATK